MANARFSIGIDLGTTNSAMAFVALQGDAASEVFAVAQLLNRRDGQPFDAHDEDRFAGFIRSIGVILETQQGLTREAAP